MEPKLSVGDILSRTFSIYRDQAGVLLPVAFWLFLLVAIAELLAGDNELSLFMVSFVFGLAVTFLYQGIVVALVKDLQDGRRDHSVGELIRLVLPVLFPLIGAGVLVGISVGFGILLLVAFLISIVVAILLALVADAIADGEIVGAVFSTLAATVTAPIEGLVASVLYFRLLELQSEPASVPQQPGDSLG